MSAPQPKAGERWRVSLDVEVKSKYEGHDGERLILQVGTGISAWALNVRIGEVRSWERLPEPEPEWQPWDLALAADGTVYRRRRPDEPNAAAYPWEVAGAGDWEQDCGITRPLTRLVPEVKS